MSDLGTDLLNAMRATPCDSENGRNTRNGVTTGFSEGPKSAESPLVTPVTPLRVENTPSRNTMDERLAGSLQALEAMAPLPGFSSSRWRVAIAAARALIADGWAQKALQLGWAPADLFGVHPAAPAARYDFMGLAFLLPEDARVIFLSENRVEIQHGIAGAVTTYRRNSATGSVLPWPLSEAKK